MFVVKDADVRVRSSNEAGLTFECLQQETGQKTTVEQALMRGLATA